jgi:sugar phosphate isomerase/epimerase
MKIGISSYSLSRALNKGEIDVLGAIEYIASIGGEHMEIVPGSIGQFTSADDPMIDKIKTAAAAAKIDLSSYTIGANFISTEEGVDPIEFKNKEVARIKEQVKIAAAFGVKFMRHDVAWRPKVDSSYDQYEKDLEIVVDACREIADFAAPYGITTSVENHGYHFQGSERIYRLVKLVNRDNFRTTMDVGNFACADEDSAAAVKNNISIASFIHFKDMLIRKNPPETAGFFPTRSGNKFLRGTITGHGDLDLRTCAEIIKASGYDGYISIEFEGPEDCLDAVKLSLNNVKALFA